MRLKINFLIVFAAANYNNNNKRICIVSWGQNFTNKKFFLCILSIGNWYITIHI